MEVVIRPATQDDQSGLRTVTSAGTRFLREVYRPTLERAEWRTSEGRSWLVAVQESRVVGAASYTPSHESLHLRDLAVLPDWRRRGIARQLVEHIVRLAAAEGLPRVTLDTIQATGNVAIFEHLGFAVTEEVRTEDFVGVTGSPMISISMARSAD